MNISFLWELFPDFPVFQRIGVLLFNCDSTQASSFRNDYESTCVKLEMFVWVNCMSDGTDVGNPDRMLSCYFILHLCISGVTKGIAAEEVYVCLTSKCNNRVIALHLNSPHFLCLSWTASFDGRTYEHFLWSGIILPLNIFKMVCEEENTFQIIQCSILMMRVYCTDLRKWHWISNLIWITWWERDGEFRDGWDL